MKSLLGLVIAVATTASPISAQTTPVPADTAKKVEPPKKHWFETFTIRGYAQIRYNRLLETNDQFKTDGDKSIGYNGGLYLRRARVVIAGQVHPRVYVYMQADFAGTAGTVNNVGVIRDWYTDIGLDDKNEFRLRLGQSKVPFGFEDLQSSQNRLPLDRSESLNSAFPGERDMGAYVMWAPKAKRDLFKSLVEDGLKGSGDYGIVTVGAINGQGLNRTEANNEMHMVGRVTWPFELGSQIIEVGAMGYSGNYVVTSDQRSAGVKGTTDFSYEDTRIGGTVVLYSKPVGVLAEYNVGRGPEYNSATDSIETMDLSGGYVTLSYRLKVKTSVVIPFLRYQAYDGGLKNAVDARHLSVNDVDAGIEWQVNKNAELTASYYIGDRTNSDMAKEDNHQAGNFLRLQMQFNF